VLAFEVEGLRACQAERTGENDDYKSPTGAMRTHITCSAGPFRLSEPLSVKWTLKYRRE
jgi:hypothetical protein